MFPRIAMFAHIHRCAYAPAGRYKLEPGSVGENKAGSHGSEQGKPSAQSDPMAPVKAAELPEQLYRSGQSSLSETVAMMQFR